MIFFLKISFLTLAFPLILVAQSVDSTYHLHYSLPIESIFFTTDNLQNLYIANTKGQIFKYNKNGKLQYEYNNKRLGLIGKIDATNPLNILVYYPDIQTIILLDRTMSEIRDINLFDLDIFETKAVAIANDNNIWLYDQVNAMLKKINREGQVLFESRNLPQIIGKAIDPVFMIEKNNQLYLSDVENGLYIFDIFGQLKQHIPIKGILQFQVMDQQLIYFKAGKCFLYSLDVLVEYEIALPLEQEAIIGGNLQGDLMVLAGEKSINVYKNRE